MTSSAGVFKPPAYRLIGTSALFYQDHLRKSLNLPTLPVYIDNSFPLRTNRSKL
jgi:hypothetical protein